MKYHGTGNRTPCANFNWIDLAILRIMGEKPNFKGIKPRSNDTPIVFSKKNPKSTETTAKLCKADLEGQASELEKAINTGKTVLCTGGRSRVYAYMYHIVLSFCMSIDRWCVSGNWQNVKEAY